MLNRLSNPLITIVSFFILLLIYTKVVGPIPFSVNSVTTQKTDTFNVTGEGKVAVKPDVAMVNVGVEANGSSVKTVQDQINLVTNRVSEAIKKLGVSADDIKTTNYSVYPNYDYTSGSQRISSYRASSNLQIKVRDIDKVNSVVDAATVNGANQVFGINFEVDDKQKAEDEARQEAVDEARRKAESAAKIAGFKLGKIVNYSESLGSGFPRPVPLSAGATMEKDTKTQIEPGSSEITVTVTLSYEVI